MKQETRAKTAVPAESEASALCRPTHFKGNAELRECAVACNGDPACLSQCQKTCVDDRCGRYREACALVGNEQVCEGRYTRCMVEQCNFNPESTQFSGDQSVSELATIAGRVQEHAKRSA